MSINFDLCHHWVLNAATLAGGGHTDWLARLGLNGAKGERMKVSRRLSCLLTIAASGLFLAGPAQAAGEMPLTVAQLRCGGEERPLCARQPLRFSWALKSSQRGCLQTAYQIQVASGLELLQSGKADLWDSGKIASDLSLNVVCAGKTLAAAQAGHWQVRVWDNLGNVSAFSRPARFDTELQSQDAWGAKWIGAGETVANQPPGQPGAENGFHAEVARTVDSVKWVQVDLGKSLPLESVRLYPAVPGNFTPPTPGFGFPLRFKLEAGDDPAFATAKTIHDATE